MKRKKWSEVEEQSLLSKYSELLKSGSLGKLKTREKKFRPIAEHVNSAHHLLDPVSFPFKWSWRDVSIKVQNMRHQYLGVKQKIRLSDHHFNWPDGDNHWDNFLKYKEVFGDVHLDSKPKTLSDAHVFGDCADLGFGIDCHEFEDEDEGDVDVDVDDAEEVMAASDGEFGGDLRSKKSKKGKKLGLVGAQVLDLRELVMRREERRMERDFDREEEGKESEFLKEKRRIDREQSLVDRECELEHRQELWARIETEKRLRSEHEHELNGERRRRMKMEEKREEEEMEWREHMLGLQIEHEKQMMQMHSDACQNQMQILGIMARFVCQFFGSAGDGLGAGLGGLAPQVLQHPGGLGDNGKPDANSPSEFL